jgi:hypothetical protein
MIRNAKRLRAGGFLYLVSLARFRRAAMSTPNRDVSVLQFRNVSGTLFRVGRRAGAEPRRRAAPDRRATHGRSKLHRLLYRAGIGPLGS